MSASPKASFASRLFGYDVFISFALGGPPRGSQSYASDLARRLREQDLSVFFSEDEAPPGEPLSGTLKSALLRSRLLVVVVNRGTLELPRWVRTEVETFRSCRPGRPVIPICLDDSFRDQALSAAVQPWLRHADSIWLDEQPASAAKGLATDALVARLLTAPRRLRANTLWRATIGAVGAGLAVLAAVAAWQAVVATRQRDRADDLGDQALSRQLAAQSAASLVRDPVRALLLAVQSRAVAPTPASDGALLGALSSLPVTRIHQHTAAFEAVAVQPRSGSLLLSDVRGAVLRGGLNDAGWEVVVAPKPGINLYGAVNAIAFSPDGQAWAWAGSSREITVHTPAGSRSLPDGDKIGESTASFVLGLAFSPDGSALAAASTGPSLRLHDLASGSSRLLLSPAVDLAAVAFSPDGRWVVAGGDRGYLQAVAVAPGAAAPRLETSAVGTVQSVAFDQSGRYLFAGSRGGSIEVFDARDGRLLARQEAPEHGALERMAVSPDGRFIVTGHGSGAVLLWSWDAAQQAWPRQLLLRHAGPVRGLAFAPDGRRLVSAGQDGRLFVTLPVDLGRWKKRPGPAPAPAAPGEGASSPRGTPSPDGRWRAWSGTAAPAPSPFTVDLDRLSAMRVPQLTVARAADPRPVVDGAELPADIGESIVAGPVFSADSSRIAVQIGQRLVFWDVAAAAPLEGSLALPPGTRLNAAAPEGKGWTAGTAAKAAEHFFFDADPQALMDASCKLAGRRLSAEEWRRYVGPERPYAPSCGR